MLFHFDAWVISVVVVAAMSFGEVWAANSTRTVAQWQIDGASAALNDSSWTVRARAIIQLEKLLEGNGMSVKLTQQQRTQLTLMAPQIAEVLREGDHSHLLSSTRARAAQLMGLLGYKPAVENLCVMAKSRGTLDERIAAIDSLAQLGAIQSAGDLLKIIDDADQMHATARITGEYIIHARAAAALGRLQYRPAIPAIKQLWRHKTLEIGLRNEAALALIRLGEINLKDVYREWLSGWSGRKFLLANAIEVITADVEAELVVLLKDSSAEAFARECAAEVIGAMRSDGNERHLLTVLSSEQEHHSLRLYAAKSVWTNEGRSLAIALATRALTEGNEQVLAVQVLQQHQATDAAPKLESLVRDAGESPSVRRAAVEALGVLEAQETAPTLLQIYETPGLAFPRWYILEAMGRMGATEAPSMILETVESQVDLRAGLDSAIWTRPHTPVSAIEVAYRQINAHHDARWLAHYWGGGTDENELLIRLLAHAGTVAPAPTTRTELRQRLTALKVVVQTPDAPQAKRDAAAMIVRLVLDHQPLLHPDDKDELSSYAVLLEENGLTDAAAAIRLLAARAASRQWMIAAVVLVTLLAVLSLGLMAWVIPAVYRFILIRRGRRWVLVASVCPSEITLRTVGGAVEAQLRNRYDSDSKPHIETVVADRLIGGRNLDSVTEMSPFAMETARGDPEYVRLRDKINKILDNSGFSPTVLVDVDWDLFDRPWAWLLGSLWGSDEGLIVAGQVTPNVVPSDDNDALAMPRSPMGKQVVFGLIVNDQPSSGLPPFRFAQDQAAAVVKQLPNIRARMVGSSDSSNASVETLKRCLREADIVHIIAHADPSWIDLQDKPFVAADLKGLELRSRLVVICGCKIGDPASGTKRGGCRVP